MKKFTMLVLTLGLVLSAGAAYAGEWHFSARFGGGRHRLSHRRGTRGITFRNVRGLRVPGYPPPPSVYIDLSRDEWRALFYSGYFRRYWWSWWYPHGGWGNPPMYYSSTVVGVDPLVGTTTTGVGINSMPSVDWRPSSFSRGVFMAPVSAPPEGDIDRLDLVDGPLVESEATVETAEAQTVKPGLSRALARISKTFREGKLERAESNLKKLLKKNPSDAQLSVVYAYVLFLREKYATSAFVLRRALMLDRKLVASGRVPLEGFHDATRSERGLAKLDEHIGAYPNAPAARLVRAYVLFLEGRPEAGRVDLSALLQANSEDPHARLLLRLLAPEAEEEAR